MKKKVLRERRKNLVVNQDKHFTFTVDDIDVKQSKPKKKKKAEK